MTIRTQRYEIRQGILPSVFPMDDVVCFQSLPRASSALLALKAIPHQAGDPQVLIQAGRGLIVPAVQSWIVQTGKVYLNILDHNLADGQRDAFHDAHDLLCVCADAWGQSPAPFAASPVQKPRLAIPQTVAALSAVAASGIHLFLYVAAMVYLA
jgi:hypothetical protein